ncbi:glycosyltransferase family 2 protein [Hymenobacter sp. B1770]|uniref:glycosyltransferase family 2 protein n=1 Tax=Hymenobacter sp. B1770 TaxID=1718788 RepID=UPI003CE9FB49
MVDISVWITTFNHEQFIAEAIESVLMQQTTFTYEIVIGEDCSTDGTRDIVLEYKSKYPERIRLLLPEKNLGMIPMTWASYSYCAGRYVAWLDGDDYWTDPFKLQKQVSFLEDNPAFSFCFHRVQIKGSRYSYISKDPSMSNTDDTLAAIDFTQIRNPAHSLSVVHRRIPIADLPAWVFNLPFPDLGLHFVFCKYGKAKYFRDVMGTYRIHDSGAHSGQSDYYNFTKVVEFFKILKAADGKEYAANIDKILKYHHYRLIKRGFMSAKAVKSVLSKLRFVYLYFKKYS